MTTDEKITSIRVSMRWRDIEQYEADFLLAAIEHARVTARDVLTLTGRKVALEAELDAARAREQALARRAESAEIDWQAAEAREAKTREALKAVLPFVATQRMACGGMKCRESWCESCQGEDDAEVSAQAGREAHEIARSALAEGEDTREAQ